MTTTGTGTPTPSDDPDWDGPWRVPPTETVGLYPGLVVHDGRVTGSITFGPTRTPLWAPPVTFSELDEYNITPDEGDTATQFVHDLLQARGEFARLLLAIANAEREDSDRSETVIADHGGLVNVTPGHPDAVTLPPPWWADPALAAPVITHLRNCLHLLTNQPDTNQPDPKDPQ